MYPPIMKDEQKQMFAHVLNLQSALKIFKGIALGKEPVTPTMLEVYEDAMDGRKVVQMVEHVKGFENQLYKLARFLGENFPGGVIQGESAVDYAIRLLSDGKDKVSNQTRAEEG